MANSDLPKGIKELRVKKGLSQEQLAEEAGLSIRTIQRIENGENVPRGDTLKRLAIALQVSPDELIDWQIVEDRNVITMLNLSQFGYIVFPLLGIIIPLAIWIFKKDKIRYVDQVGKSILNFQITWVVVLFLFYTLLVAKFFLKFRFPITTFHVFVFIVSMYVYNGIIIIINTISHHKWKKTLYKPAIPFLR